MVTIYQIRTPPDAERPFCAGIIVTNRKVTQTARIVKYMRGWSLRSAKEYCSSRGWEIEEVRQTSEQR